MPCHSRFPKPSKTARLQSDKQNHIIPEFPCCYLSELRCSALKLRGMKWLQPTSHSRPSTTNGPANVHAPKNPICPADLRATREQKVCSRFSWVKLPFCTPAFCGVHAVFVHCTFSRTQGTTKRTTRQGLLRAQIPLLYAMTYFWNVQGTGHSKVGDITDPYTFLGMVRLLDGNAKTGRAVWTAPPLPKHFSSSAVEAKILTV